MRVGLDERKRRILNAIIEDYILTATPVGSRTLEKKYFANLSSATIRNEMSDLAEMGYLLQPHVSAGRVPTLPAYRLYVDDLLRREIAPLNDERFAFETLSTRRMQLEDLLPAAAQVLSDLTGMPSVIILPKQEELKIRCLQLIPMPQSSALLVVITESGTVSQSVIRVSDKLDDDALFTISKMLTERFSGRTLSEVQMMLTVLESRGSNTVALDGISQLARQMQKQSSMDTIAIGGRHNILNYPEYSDVEKARALLSVLDDKEQLARMLRDTKGVLSVHIGAETGIPEMRECAAVTYRYTSPGRSAGTISVIGPARMPYNKVFSALVTVGQALTGLLGGER